MDYWLTIGLAYFLSGLFVRHHFGNGEYRIRLLMDIETLSEIDHHKNALYSGNPSQFVFMDDYQDSKLLQIKSPIIISMLERYLGKNVMQKVGNCR